MSKKTNGSKPAPREGDELSPRWQEVVTELGKLRDVVVSGEPVDRHFRVDVVAPDAELAEVLAALRQERARLGLTLAEVSRRTGIDESDLNRLESGKTADPHVSTVTRYARALGKRLAWKLVGAGESPGSAR